MIQQKTITTHFSRMQTDRTSHRPQAGEYVYLLNGRIAFNQTNEGRGEMGMLMPQKGTKLATTLCPGYVPIGGCDLGKDAFIVSNNGTNTEFGLLVSNKDAVSYKPLFNDKFDPNNTKFLFSSGRRIQVVAEVQSPTKRLIYLLDPNNSPIYVINLARGYNDQKAAYHKSQICSVSETYPKWWSLHHFSLQPEFFSGELVFHSQPQTGGGGLKSGVYRYSYRGISKHGDIVSGWTTPSDPYFVTAETDDYGNHHSRRMGASKKASRRNNRLIIRFPDLRWYGVEVAAMYADSENTYSRVAVIGRFPITTFTDGKPVVDIQHTSNKSQYSLPLDALRVRQQPIKTAGDITLHDNRIFVASPVLEEETDVDVSGVTFGHVLRQIKADETILPGFVTKDDPLTNSAPTIGELVPMTRFTGVNKDLFVVGDWKNYKGVQYSASFRGYGRGDTVPLGVTVFGKTGQSEFTRPLGSVTMPTISEAPLSKLDTSGGLFQFSRWRQHLQALGIKVNGIRLKKSDVLDEFGRAKISGFSIVRGDVESSVLHRGVLLPTVQIVPSSTGKDPKRPNATFPLPSAINKFESEYAGQTGTHRHEKQAWFYQGAKGDKGFGEYVQTSGSEIGATFLSRPGTHLYYSPDIFIEETFDFDKTVDELELIATMHPAYSADYKQFFAPNSPIGGYTHYYTKQYVSSGDTNPGPGRPKMNSKTRMRNAVLLDKVATNSQDVDSGGVELNYDPDNPNLYFEPHSHVQNHHNGFSHRQDALHAPNSVLVRTMDWESVDVTGPLGLTASAHLAAYHKTFPNERSPIDPESGTSASARFYSTGHFQPLTEAFIAQASHSTDENGVEWVTFNDIEVWGGNMFVNLFAFTRLYPFWSEGCSVRYSELDRRVMLGYFPDYSDSHIIPIESKYNLALVYGRNVAANGVAPQQEQCQGTQRTVLSNGIMSRQPEEWGYNRSLLHTETLFEFVQRPPDAEFEASRPFAVYYSEHTINGELRDSKRLIKPLSYKEIEGKYGPITNLVVAFDMLYALQAHSLVHLPTKNREMIQATNGPTYITGTGSVIDQPRYITTNHGCQQPLGVAKLRHAFYWIDQGERMWCRFSQDGLSELDTERGFKVSTDIQIPLSSGYHLMPNFDKKEITLWIHAPGKDAWPGMIYNEVLDGLTTVEPVYTPFTLVVGPRIFVSNPDSKHQLSAYEEGAYGNWFGKEYPVVLSFYQTSDGDRELQYNNVLVSISRGDALLSIKGETDNDEGRITHIVYPAEHPAARYYSGKHRIPLVEPYEKKMRLRGQVLTLTFTLKPTNEFVLYGTETFVQQPDFT